MTCKFGGVNGSPTNVNCADASGQYWGCILIFDS